MDLENITIKVIKMLRKMDVNIDQELKNLFQLEYIRNRINNEEFTNDQYIKGFIYSLFSSKRTWFRDIYYYLDDIDKIFNDYNPEFIRDMNIEDTTKRIKETGANIFWKDNTGNRLHYLIDDLDTLILLHDHIEKNYGDLSKLPGQIQNLLSLVNSIVTNGNRYRLHGFGYPLTWEFLKNIGIPGIKFDTHVKRILNDRLNLFNNMSDSESQLNIFKYFSEKPDIDIFQNYDWRQRIVIFDNIIWLFGERGFCSKNNPNCQNCDFNNNICKYSRREVGQDHLNNNQSRQNRRNRAVGILPSLHILPDIINPALEDAIKCICKDIQPNDDNAQWESSIQNKEQWERLRGKEFSITFQSKKVSTKVSTAGKHLNIGKVGNFRQFIREHIIDLNKVRRNQSVSYDLIKSNNEFKISNIKVIDR